MFLQTRHRQTLEAERFCGRRRGSGLWTRLQVVVVRLAAAVGVSVGALVQVEHGAQAAEEPPLPDRELLTWTETEPGYRTGPHDSGTEFTRSSKRLENLWIGALMDEVLER